jgi:Sedlin, N-terminal conserved region
MKTLLIGVAIIGKSNEPLYLCDCEESSVASSSFSNSDNNPPVPPLPLSPTVAAEEEDAFGFVAAAQQAERRHSLPIHRQILVHAALDSLDEMIQTNVAGQMPVIRNPTKHVPHWVGLLRQVEEAAPPPHGLSDKQQQQHHYYSTCVYAYVTATNIKFMALTKTDSTAGTAAPNVSLDTIAALQRFMKELHQHYSNYIANPFSDTRGPIRSAQFDAGVQQSIRKVQQPTVVVD